MDRRSAADDFVISVQKTVVIFGRWERDSETGIQATARPGCIWGEPDRLRFSYAESSRTIEEGDQRDQVRRIAYAERKDRWREAVVQAQKRNN